MRVTARLFPHASPPAGNMVNSLLTHLVEAPTRRRTIPLQARNGSMAPTSLRQEETTT
jgi:hypothetical protein